ncbi:MoaD/ThiS family protein [Lignipirellula cremea]|uniref:ThiS family protein n=1 Tax=Lignipirellula cremea TaxID=2528010 RepID=A0A518DR92_9BACT|nr:MoaD/ThiS family protein [Lignipirellula cremea]QDU94342.1 hypothetical protein Pla8534_21310 [Lignipirellula cremea]
MHRPSENLRRRVSWTVDLQQQKGRFVPRVSFTANLQRHVDCSAAVVAGATVREALEAVFQERPSLRSYLLDDQQALRQHVMIFIDGRLLIDRTQLSDPVEPESEIYIMQALSGG